MNKSLLCVSIVFVLYVNCFTWTEGVRCYDCIYIDSDDLPEDAEYLIDESCQEGGTPNEYLLTNCSSGQICGKFHANRTIPYLASAEISARGCVDKIDDLFNKCVDNMTVAELSQYDDFALSLFLSWIPTDEVPTVCTSESNNFNFTSNLIF